MCVILLSLHVSSKYPFVLAANRDEYYRRPSATAQFWSDCPDLLGGRDLEAGGTWLGINRTGQFAAITNHFDPASTDIAPRSRGEIVSTFLQSDKTVDQFAEQLRRSDNQYNGYGLLFGDFSTLYYHSNKTALTTTLCCGIHALSNSLINSPWPRVQAGRLKLQQAVEKDQDLLLEHLFDILIDQQSSSVSSHGKNQSSTHFRHPANAPMFIRTKDYGTRSSTVILVDHELNVVFEERTYGDNHEDNQVRRQFGFQVHSDSQNEISPNAAHE